MMIIYDKKQLLEIVQAFYTASGIRVGLLYANTQEFFSWPQEWSSFCSLVRSNPEINKKCVECDLFYMEKCKKTNAPIVYTCHLGLTEVLAPFKENNIIICYFMFGQIIIEESKEETRLKIYNNTKEAGFDDIIPLEKTIEQINCVSSCKLEAWIKIFEAVISQIISRKLIEFSKAKFINMLNSFIDAHISEDVLIRDLYNHFQISRTNLYEHSKKYLDCGLGEYILNRKIDHAKSLLMIPNIKIGEISEKIGFSDYNYFSRVFKKKTGISPRAYRRSKDSRTGNTADAGLSGIN